jgi:hypothetical protein
VCGLDLDLFADMADLEMDWRTSSYTGNGGGNCVEVADAARVVLVRHTKDRDGAVIEFSAGAWRAFGVWENPEFALEIN